MIFSRISRFKKRFPFLFWLFAVTGGIVVLLISFYFYISYILPLPNFIGEGEYAGTTKIYDRNGILLYEIFQPDTGKKSFIPIVKIPQTFINATLASEDIRFYEHEGVDFGAIARAIIFNVSEQRIVSGASTITQQLVRNLLGSGTQRNLSDKVMEAMYAVRLSHLYSKDQILELYLNKIYYGNLAYGVESASLDYFGKHVYDLDLAESTLLAGLPQAPSYYNPFLYFDRAKKRQQYVLDQMVKYHFIDQPSADAAAQEPLKLRHNKVQMKAPHFVQYVIGQLDSMVGQDTLEKGGMTVYTTLDYNLQLAAENIVTRQVKSLSDKNVTNGALLSIEPQTGKILAWVGSENYYDDSIDGQVDMITSLRQPGSSIKPLTYLLALEKGYTPATILYDVPTQFNTDNGPYEPKNYDLQFHGPVRVREALASSFNIPAVKTLDYVGLESFIGFLERLGIDTLDKNPNFYGLALTLGGGDVRMYDMARAFNMVANYGNESDLSSIQTITDAKGRTIYSGPPPLRDFVLGQYGKEHSYQIIDILKDPLARLKGFGEGSVLELSHEAAVKTGTTRNFRDNWTIGFTPQILTAVWVGNADASPMKNISGVDGAGPIWHDFMEEALRFMPQVKFSIPTRLKKVQICALSGMLPTDNCPDRIDEWFVTGSEPKEKDNYFQKVWILNSNGHIIPSACVDSYPLASRQEKVIIAYPPPLQSWAALKGLALPPSEPCALSKSSSRDYTTDYTVGYNSLLSIDSPGSQDEYQIDPGIPGSSQKIPFRVITPLQTSSVSYWLNGKKVTQISSAPFNFMWVPEKGKHVLKAIAELGDGTEAESNEVNFSVR